MLNNQDCKLLKVQKTLTESCLVILLVLNILSINVDIKTII